MESLRQTCSIKSSFAEKQKHQRATKLVCSVNKNTAKMQALHKMMYSRVARLAIFRPNFKKFAAFQVGWSKKS